MTQKQAIQLFEERKVRTVWDDETEKWYFAIVDVVAILTESADAAAYWRKLKQRLKAEGNETVTNCHGLKMLAADGKMRLTDVADTTQLFRLIQSIPSPKAEPFKQWMAQVASDRLDQMQDPEMSIEQAMADYKRLGYSENWINQRLKSMEVRKELTDEWQRRGVEGQQFATLTDIITQAWADRTTKSYKQFKGLKKENLRDNMTNIELALNTLAEASVTEISKQRRPKGFQQNVKVARSGGSVAFASTMNENIRLEWFKPDLTAPLEVPLMDSGVHAGFPSPADDSIEQPLDLNKLVAPNPNATFFARVVGDSMKDAHIEEGDLLAVDKSADPLDGDVVVSFIDGEFTLKTIRFKGAQVWLVPANEKYKPIEVTTDCDFRVWGVVRYVIKKVKK